MRRLALTLTAVAVTALALALAGCSTNTSEDTKSYNQTLSAANSAAKDSGPHIPKGYSDATTGLAFKWDHDDSLQCTYGSCNHLSVYAYEDCPNGVYVEANLLRGNTVVDYTNGTLSRLDKKQKGLIELDYTSGVTKLKLTKLECN